MLHRACLLMGFVFTLTAFAYEQPRAIYGHDNRRDTYQITDPAILQLARSSVALISQLHLHHTGDGYYNISSRQYGERYGLCAGESFWDQPTAPYCSGSLVTPDIVLTAGHCIWAQSDCHTTRFVFDYKVNSPAEYPERVPMQNVYSCRHLLYRVETKSDDDFALIQLDRPVIDRHPVPMRTSGRIGVGDQVFVIGYPLGLPQKVAGPAIVRQILPDYFVTNLDTFVNNSGSPVFNLQTHMLEGLLVEGETDLQRHGQCKIAKVCPSDGCSGESVTDISLVVAKLRELGRLP